MDEDAMKLAEKIAEDRDILARIGAHVASNIRQHALDYGSAVFNRTFKVRIRAEYDRTTNDYKLHSEVSFDV